MKEERLENRRRGRTGGFAGNEREVISEGRDISGSRNGEIKRPRVVLFMARYYAICRVLAGTKILAVMEM